MKGFWLIIGGVIAFLILWFAIRLGKFTNECDKDTEKMNRKWLRNKKKKYDSDLLSERHEEM